uniref:WRKY domain-containing protein n=1 Tax=Kalanchoe fedtschenkoi TaxID=63787 RepID=A0A7N0VKE2_KALFE
MEATRSNRPWEHQALINELKQGRELAKQLRNHLNPSTASSQTRQFLVEKIISSYEKTLAKLNRSSLPVAPSPSDNNTSSSKNSHKSQGSDHHASKKRKAMPKWTKQVQVKSQTGLEGQVDDGHGWRKYGQKNIQGVIHPRGYYRCTNRHVQSCLATKQVQRSDQDPTIFHITYRGQHNCTKSANPTTQPQQQPDAQQKRTKLFHTHDSFRFSFGVRKEQMSMSLEEEQMFPTFSSFPATSDSNFSPLYICPPTSESDFYTPCHVAGFGLSQLNVHRSESDLAETAGSCLNSVLNSPTGVLDLHLDFPTGSATTDFDSTFLFDFE